jgi:hypothetical protein
VEINEYDTFSDKGKVIVQDKITRRSEYILYMRSSTTDVTARLVAGGHLTETPVDSVYSVLYPYAAFGSLRSSPNSTAVTPGAQIFLVPT